MNIIDTHTHLPGYAFDLQTRTASDLREEFENEGLTGAWIFTTDGLLIETEDNNDILAESVKNDLDFFVPFCTINPHRGKEKSIAELIRAKEKLGMHGIKFHPWLQAFSLMNSAVLPIIEKAAEFQMPILFHDGTPPYSTPLQIAAVAEKVPDATIILGHAGLDDLYRDAILACLRHPNIYLGLCSPSSGNMTEIIKQCPIEKILFGSDAGFCANLIKNSIEKVKATGASKDQLQKIFYDNPQQIVPL